MVNPVQQWDIDSHNMSLTNQVPHPHPQPSIPHVETNGVGYRLPVMPSVSMTRPSSGGGIMQMDSLNPQHRGLPVSAITPVAGLIPSSHSTRPSSASPVVVNRQSPLPAGGKSDGDVPHKD